MVSALSGRSIVALLVAGALLGTLLAAQVAHASAFYNDGDRRILVSLDCGTFCSNDFALLPGDSGARPGVGGNFWINDDAPWCEHDSHPNVAAHGFASFHKRSDKPPYYWAIYRADDSLMGNYGIIFGGLSPIYKQCYEQ